MHTTIARAALALILSLLAGPALLVLTRLRRRDPRTGWLVVIGGTFVTTMAVFSFARGIDADPVAFHGGQHRSKG